MLSPFLVIFMGTLITYKLYKLNKEKKDWKIGSLSVIPITFIILYSWIIIFTPLIEVSRNVLRIIVISDMAISLHVVSEYLKELRRKGGK